MKSFEYAAPKNVKGAAALLSDTWGRTEILAGGTDLVTALKQRITQPSRVVSLRNIPELKGLEAARGALQIGAMTTLGELAAHKIVRENFPALVIAAEGVSSPQLLAVGTVGGDLCQRPRCWYFRNGFGLFGQRGDTSLVREGDNRYHAIFGNDGPALFVHPSSLAPALVALGATITLTAWRGKPRTIPAAEFFRTPRSESERETVLKPDEILTGISVPMRGLRNATYEVRHRHGLDWPYVTASVALQLKGGKASEARVVLGQVAPVPWLSPGAGAALTDAILNEGTAARGGEAAVQGAKPLRGNAYKIQMVKVAVKRALLAAVA